MASDIGSIIAAICRADCAPWWETYGRIIDKRGELVKPQANVYQTDIGEVIKWMREQDLPVRTINLKPRQKGSSTYTSGELYHCANARPITGLIVGGSHEQASNLYRKIGVYSKYDGFAWGTNRNINNEVATFRFLDGPYKGRESTIKRLTAANENVGRSDTYQFLLITELARWAGEGVANAAEVMTGLLKTVGPLPGTTIIIESTARGASGDFYDRYWSALPFDEFKAAYHRGDNMVGRFVRIFAPWFVFEDSRIALTEQQRSKLFESIHNPTRRERATYDDEVSIMAQFGLDLEQMAWRRWAIDEECDGDPVKFEEDYPSTEKSAFLTSGQQRFNRTGMSLLRSGLGQKNADYGTLDMLDDGSVSWRSTDEREHTAIVWDPPRVNRRYLLSVDLMTGASQTTSADPDSHAAPVLRAGDWVAGKGWEPPAMVARLRSPCFWDIDVLEDQVYRLSRYYGDCIIIPEMNMDRGLVELLKLRGDANIYQREKFNEREKKMTKLLGWLTDKHTRPKIIEVVAKAIRELHTDGEGLVIWDEELMDQLESFVRKESGREEALGGKHDDLVLALAIGLANQDFATRYRPRPIKHTLPPDLREYGRRKARSRQRA